MGPSGMGLPSQSQGLKDRTSFQSSNSSSQGLKYDSQGWPSMTERDEIVKHAAMHNAGQRKKQSRQNAQSMVSQKSGMSNQRV
jgi:hypothetical protein